MQLHPARLRWFSFPSGRAWALRWSPPWTGSGVSSTTFEIGTGLYFIVMAMISSAVGGYLAGRLRTKWTGIQTAEVQFRDTAHGFLAWAVASVFGAIVLASPASSLMGGAASGATSAATNSAQSSPVNGYVDTLLRPDNSSAQAQQNSSDSHGEMVRLFTTSFRQDGDLNPADRTYVAKVVSARTGLSQADAEKRVNGGLQSGEGRPRSRPQDRDAARDLADAVAIHRRVFRSGRGDGRRRPSRRDLGKEDLRQARTQSLTLEHERRDRYAHSTLASSEFRFR